LTADLSKHGGSKHRGPIPGWAATGALGLALFVLNVYVCRELFRVEYLSNMGSIEGAFIGISRYAMAHWNDLTWFPLWSDGIPYPTTYPPLLHLVVAFTAWAGGISPAHAYHWITALAYCLGPVALFALTLRLSGSRWAGFVAGLVYTAVPTSAWLVPAIHRDLGGFFYSRRLQALAFYGEGPHVSSMTLLTLALLCLDLAMGPMKTGRHRAPYVMLAAVAFAATASTNWLGAFAIALIVAPYVLANLGRDAWKLRDVGWLVLIGAAAYCLAMPLMPPSTIAVLQRNARSTGGDYSHAYQAAVPQGLAILAALVGIKFAIRRLAPYLQFAILFAFLMSLVTLADAWWGIGILPMAVRYHLEMEMALAILTALGAWALFRDRSRWMAAAAILALTLALIQPIRLQRRWARVLLRPIDITQTVEWRTAQWLNQNWTGERVFLPGSISIWLNAFSDVPQLWGFDQGMTNPMVRFALFTIYTGEAAGVHNADVSVLWLKALGVQAVGVSGPASTEAYKPFVSPRKFEGVLEPMRRDGDDVVYRVSQRASLARVVPRGTLVSRVPVHGLDVDPLRPYVNALDDQRMPRAGFHWSSAHSATIATNLDPGQVVSVQMSWHAGWHAIVNGRPTPVQHDAIGLMYLDPQIAGPCTIEMVYDGGMETRVAHWLCALAALLLIGASIRAILIKV